MEDKVISNESRVLKGLSVWILNLLVDMAVVGRERGVSQLLKSSVKKRNGQSIIRSSGFSLVSC